MHTNPVVFSNLSSRADPGQAPGGRHECVVLPLGCPSALRAVVSAASCEGRIKRIKGDRNRTRSVGNNAFAAVLCSYPANRMTRDVRCAAALCSARRAFFARPDVSNVESQYFDGKKHLGQVPGFFYLMVVVTDH